MVITSTIGNRVAVMSGTRVQIPPSPPNKKRNFDTKLRFFFFAQNRLNKGLSKKDKFPSEIYNRKKHSFYY